MKASSFHLRCGLSGIPNAAINRRRFLLSLSTGILVPPRYANADSTSLPIKLHVYQQGQLIKTLAPDERVTIPFLSEHPLEFRFDSNLSADGQRIHGFYFARRYAFARGVSTKRIYVEKISRDPSDEGKLIFNQLIRIPVDRFPHLFEEISNPMDADPVTLAQEALNVLLDREDGTSISVFDVDSIVEQIKKSNDQNFSLAKKTITGFRFRKSFAWSSGKTEERTRTSRVETIVTVFNGKNCYNFYLIERSRL